MILDDELVRWLNLLRASKKFVLKDKPDGGASVLSPVKVPAGDGYYWIFGETILNSGGVVESVFHVDTDSGGELREVFWFLRGRWFDHRDPEARAALGGGEAVFPFDWRFSVPLERDAHH